jgi:hypothetical protein
VGGRVVAATGKKGRWIVGCVRPGRCGGARRPGWVSTGSIKGLCEG